MREETKESMVAYNGPIVCCHKSAEEKKNWNLHEEEMEDSDDKERCGVVKAVLYYWHKFRMETEGEENRRVLEKNKGKAESRER